MTKFVCALCVLLFGTAQSLNAASFYAKPTGIWRDTSRARALFEEFSDGSQSPRRTIAATAGERFALSNGKQTFAITSVDPEQGKIGAQVGESDTVFQIQGRLESNAVGAIFDAASADQVVAIYSRLAKKAVLIHPEIPGTLFSFSFRYETEAEGATALRKKLKDSGGTIVPFNESFELLLPERLAGQKIDISKFLKPQPPGTSLELGSIQLNSSPLSQVLDVCADFIGAELDRSSLRGIAGNLRHEVTTIAPTSREDTGAALQLLLSWYDLRLVRSSEGNVKAEVVTAK